MNRAFRLSRSIPIQAMLGPKRAMRQEREDAMYVLVGYASAQGSTAEVARRIGSVIETGGMSVDVLPIKDVASLVDYDAVVLGSAIHTQSWLPEATDFMQTHATELSARDRKSTR